MKLVKNKCQNFATLFQSWFDLIDYFKMTYG